MNNELEKYLYDDPDAYFESNSGKLLAQSIHGKSNVRYKKALEQAEMKPVDKNEISSIIIDFLNKIGIETTKDPVISPNLVDYSKIKEEYELADQRDIVWIKFTEDGYVGVVAASSDINFNIPNSSDDYNKKHKVFNSYLRRYEEKWSFTTSGIIIHKLGKKWDESFVLLFPLKNIPLGYTRGDIEKAIGNLLIEKNIPILDYYSHLY